jgi:hypothetical protein
MDGPCVQGFFRGGVVALAMMEAAKRVPFKPSRCAAL